MFDMRRDDQTSLSSKSIVDWNQFFRDITARYFEENPIVIGGPGSIVEIDETVISRRKYNRGRLICEQEWFFGGVERGSNRCFIVRVETRDITSHNSKTYPPWYDHYLRFMEGLFSNKRTS